MAESHETMENRIRALATLSESKAVEMLPGIYRTTLSYNEEIMFCHFRLKKGAGIPLHHHPAVQSGYVISGKIRFLKKDRPGFIAEAGSSYVFMSEEQHGAEVLEDAEVVECFAPLRPELIDK